MDIHINKKIAGLMIASLIVGGIIGGAIGFMTASEEGHGERGGYEMNNKGDNVQFDNHADGEANDDQGSTPPAQAIPVTPPTTTPVPAQ